MAAAADLVPRCSMHMAAMLDCPKFVRHVLLENNSTILLKQKG